MKLLIDMNLSPRWTDVLRVAGMKQCIGRRSGRGQHRIATSCNLRATTIALSLRTTSISATSSLPPAGAKPSVVQIRASGVGVARIGAQVVGGLALCAEELEAGALVTIDASRTRIRLLPLPFRRPL